MSGECLDGPRGQAAFGGDVLGRHVREIVQYENLALAHRQPHQRAAQRAERHGLARFGHQFLTAAAQPR